MYHEHDIYHTKTNSSKHRSYYVNEHILQIPLMSLLSNELIFSFQKVVKDPIHGIVSLPSYCMDVIDTPEFQRLRNIKQLTAETVYPGATHNRFAHSIG